MRVTATADDASVSLKKRIISSEGERIKEGGGDRVGTVRTWSFCRAHL